MKFKNFQMIIDSQTPIKADLKKVSDYGLTAIKDYGSDWYTIEKSFEEDRFLWIYSEYDNALVYNENVFNGENDEKQRNPRDKSQVELKKQLFACYDTNTNLLYLNNLDKRGFIQHYISSTLQKEVLIKNIYASLEEFQESVKTITKLKFVQERNLMNLIPNSIFQQQANIFGFDAPERITMQVDYGNTPIGTAKNAIRNFKQWKDAGNFENIVLVGVDDNQIEQRFDFSSLIKAFELNIAKNENRLYDSEKIKYELLNIIR